MNGEIDDDAKAHLLRAASFKFERRLRDIQAAAFEAQSKARADYLAEVAEFNGGAERLQRTLAGDMSVLRT